MKEGKRHKAESLKKGISKINYYDFHFVKIELCFSINLNVNNEIPFFYCYCVSSASPFYGCPCVLLDLMMFHFT